VFHYPFMYSNDVGGFEWVGDEVHMQRSKQCRVSLTARVFCFVTTETFTDIIAG